MSGKLVGSRVKRNEDPRLLTGRALFVDDVERPGMLHVAFLRSPFAHARITSVDTEMAREAPGVHAVYVAEDLGDYWQPGPLLVPPPPVEGATFHQRTQVPLAKDKIRHLGEPVAMIVADSRALAEDAADMIFLDCDPLDAVVDIEKALEEGAPRGSRRPRLERRGPRAAEEGRLRGRAELQADVVADAPAASTTAVHRRRWRTAASSRSGTG